MPSLTVHLKRANGTPIGDVEMEDQVWAKLDPDVAVQVMELEPASVQMVYNDELAVIMRIVDGSNVEFRLCTKAEAEDINNAFGGRGSLYVDAYVLRADGTIEH
jgi:hypothetical protein